MIPQSFEIPALTLIQVLDSSTVVKQGEDGWNSNIYSLEGYLYSKLSFTVKSILSSFAGFSKSPSLNTMTSNVDYAFYLSNDGSMNIYESNTFVKGISGIYTSETVFGIIYDGTTMKYYVDGFSVYESPCELFVPLYANFALYNLGGCFENIHFEFVFPYPL
jgi:hypothetical protein